MPTEQLGDAVPAVVPGPGKRKRIGVLTTFLTDLQRRLPLACSSGDSRDAESLAAEIDEHIHTLRNARVASDGHKTVELDKAGTNLWNLCTRLRREGEHGIQTKSTVLRGRVLAFLALDLARWSEAESNWTDASHLLRIALKASKACLDAGEAEIKLAEIVLQHGAGYNERLFKLSAASPPPEAEERERRRLWNEYFVHRITVGWKTNRLDVSEHMYSKIPPTAELGVSEAEVLADVLYEVGKDLAAKKDHTLAVKWLNRAYEALESQSLEILSREATELQLAIMQSLVRTYLELKTDEGRQNAERIVRYLASELGDKPVVLLLELELLGSPEDETFDTTAYGHVLRRMIRVFSPSDSYFKVVISHIRKLHGKNPRHACKLLDEFLPTLCLSGHEDWVEKAVVHRVWMAQESDDPELVDEAGRVFSQLQQPLGADATMAALALIWKKAETGYNQSHFDVTSNWCRLGLQDVFGNRGPGNTAKLQRKLIQCCTSLNDFDAARAIYYAMTEAAQREALTCYLMHKAAVRSGDEELAAECLENVALANPAREYLYACVVDAQQTGEKRCAIAALKKLVLCHELKAPGPVHLPALLRCTIRLLWTCLDDQVEGDSNQSVTIQDLCDMFEGAVKVIGRAPSDENGNSLFDITELEWFCRSAYNLGMKHASTSTWSLRHIVQILEVCISIRGAFPQDLDADTSADLSLKAIFCHFMIASALVALARAEDKCEQRGSDYRRMREHIAAFDNEFQSLLKSLDERVSEDLVGKLAILLVFDFEGALAGEQWPELAECVRRAEICKDAGVYQAMGDCLLRSNMPPESLFSTMRCIINALWKIGGFTPEKLAKFNRCLFQATLPRSHDNALHLLRETKEMAQGLANQGEAPLPREELEWMATVAFNEGVDFYARNESQTARQWIMEAINLAHLCADDGGLGALLTEKFTMLTWENTE